MKILFIIVLCTIVLTDQTVNGDDFSLLRQKKESLQKEETSFDSYNNMTELEEYPNVCDDYEKETCAVAWMTTINHIYSRNENRRSVINYQYETNINKNNRKQLTELEGRRMKLNLKLRNKLIKFKWKGFKEPTIKRIFKLLTPSMISNNESLSRRILNLSNNIEDIYNNGAPCFVDCLTKGEKGIVYLFRSETDYDKLAGFWSSWRNETGRKIKDLYVERMNLENEMAKESGLSDAVFYLLNNEFEEVNFNETVINLYSEILPLYKQLHGYVRYCLSQFYPRRFNSTGPIPAHILGNVWAQQWQNIMPILQKCQGKTISNDYQTEANKNLESMSVKQMFQMAEEFYTSIDMYPMTPKFWERSVLSQQPGKLIDCHGSAHSFSNNDDFRILMCTKQNIDDFTTVHHEMGHIQYYMAYRNLERAFKSSANPGFHESIGDTIGLSVKTPKHLQKVGLISSKSSLKDFDTDYLLMIALEKVAFLPFALTMDSYVWSIYNGSVPHSKLNKHWWDLSYRFQGIEPPNQRTENDFDAAAKYHIAFGMSYTRYFASFIHQFQFYETMCKLSGYSGPLHLCDFYGSKIAGRKMLEMLKNGRKQHWRITLEAFTGSPNISSKSLMRFFEPLRKWLEETNIKLKIPIGW